MTNKIKITLAVITFSLIVISIAGAVAYKYRPVCYYTNATLNDKDGSHELYACKRLGWLGKL